MTTSLRDAYSGPVTTGENSVVEVSHAIVEEDAVGFDGGDRLCGSDNDGGI